MISDGNKNHQGQNSSRIMSFNSTFNLVLCFTPKHCLIYSGQTHWVLGHVLPTGKSHLYWMLLMWFRQNCFHLRGSPEAPLKFGEHTGYNFLPIDAKGGRGPLCSVHIIQP